MSDVKINTVPCIPSVEFIRMNQAGKEYLHLGHLRNFLTKSGFFKIKTANGTFQLVHQKGHRIEVTSPNEIRDFLISYLKANGHEKEIFIVIGEHGKLTERFFDLLETNQVKFVRDTLSEGFVFFRNGFVKVTSHGFELHSYDSLHGVIWKSSAMLTLN